MVTHAGEERQAVAVVGQRAPEILQTVIVAIPVSIPSIVAENSGINGHVGIICNFLLFFQTLYVALAELYKVIISICQVRVSTCQEIELVIVLRAQFEVVHLCRVGRLAVKRLPERHEYLVLHGGVGLLIRHVARRHGVEHIAVLLVGTEGVEARRIGLDNGEAVRHLDAGHTGAVAGNVTRNVVTRHRVGRAGYRGLRDDAVGKND